MSGIDHLPGHVAAQYSELMQNCIHPLSDGSNISFKSKTVNGKRYWYLYISLGSSRREHYLGEETTELLDRIADEREAWESNRDDRDVRARLVSMLIAGGMTPTPRDEGKLLALLERSGVFLAGGALVGTAAFKAYANMLGVSWPTAPRTQDIDIAVDDTFLLALPRDKAPVRLGQVILESGMGFFEVPALDRKRPSTSYRIRGKEFRVDLLAPMRGRETERPVRLNQFDTYAQPVRYLDYLLHDLQAAVLLFGHGVMVNVPSPSRFAVHKCVVSQMRVPAFATKARKDLTQAEQLFQVLATDRPGDVILAFEAAEKMGARFLERMRAGLERLSDETRAAIRAVA
jgi:hypothetical protein